ncbi:MAG: ATP-binding protein [Planctomycetota bacterium]
MDASGAWPASGPQHASAGRGLSIRHKLGLLLLALGAVVLGLIGITYQTVKALGTDNELKELCWEQESSLLRIQLLVMGFLQGEDFEAEIESAKRSFGRRHQGLLSGRGGEALSSELRPALERSWASYSVAIDQALEAQKALAGSQDRVLRQFAPWLASLAALEAEIDVEAVEDEPQLDLIADCRSLSSNLNSAFFKLVSAPAGDPDNQARLSLSVAVDAARAALAALRDGDPGGEVRPLSGELALEALADTEACWAALDAALNTLVRCKQALLATAYSSSSINLEDSLDAMMATQERASLCYEAIAEARRYLLTCILMASLGLVVVVIGFSMRLVGRSVVAPLSRLSGGTQRLADGDFTARIEVESRDELGDLARSFNAMADSLAQSRRELRAWADTLEDQVRARTSELRTANEQLKAQSEERERIEGELRLAQKLEAVGQLAAGLAHEINTPIQYVNDNTTFVNRAFADASPVLQKAVDVAKRLRDGAASGADAEALLELAEEADLEFLLEEVPSSLQQALEGLQRVAKIVKAMKEYSHPGSDEMIAVDLNHAIDGTITVARGEWRRVADLQVDFAPGLPAVECAPGEFNQVMLNLIVNAAHAIGDVLSERPENRGKIRICTQRDGDHVVIRVADSGQGIPEEIRGKIFDQFFTTKEVGRGTGQGLSLAYSVVVRKHGGTIDVESEVGRGTTFIVRLPIEQRRRVATSVTG